MQEPCGCHLSRPGRRVIVERETSLVIEQSDRLFIWPRRARLETTGHAAKFWTVRHCAQRPDQADAGNPSLSLSRSPELIEMASSLPPPSPAAAAVAPHLTPVVHTLTTPDLVPILRRSKLESMSELLGAFESSVERVTVRSTNYEPRQLHRFGVKFVERPLPPWFEDKVGGGAAVGARARSGTVGSARGRPHDGQPGSPLLSRTSLSTPAAHQTPQTPQTPFSWPTQTERDELFLDSLSSAVSSNIDTWLAQTGREELDVRGKRPKRRLPEIGEDVEPEVDPDEGWQGRSIEALTPWYAAMRDGVLKRREMVEWDTFAWPVACTCIWTSSRLKNKSLIARLIQAFSRSRPRILTP